MKRRQLIRYSGMSLLTILGAIATKSSPAQASGKSVTIEYLGHTCFLFSSNGFKVLVNPFSPLGCTAEYKEPNVEADLVLISSFLLDEGSVENLSGNPKIFTEPGDYKVSEIKFQGISSPHDREGGRRFGKNIAWLWNQGGIKILHLGGAVAPISLEEKILIGNPDVLFIPVGGGAKAYDPAEATKAVKAINPKVIIPTHYLTSAADKESCDLAAVDEFLALNQDKEIKKLNVNRIAIKPSDLPKDKKVVRVLKFS